MEILRGAVAHGERADRIAHDADLIGVGDAYRRPDVALLGDPRQTGHLAVAVERVEAGEDVIGPDLGAARPDRGDPGAHDTGRLADQCRIADPHAGDVGDRV